MIKEIRLKYSRWKLGRRTQTIEAFSEFVMDADLNLSSIATTYKPKAGYTVGFSMWTENVDEYVDLIKSIITLASEGKTLKLKLKEESKEPMYLGAWLQTHDFHRVSLKDAVDVTIPLLESLKDELDNIIDNNGVPEISVERILRPLVEDTVALQCIIYDLALRREA